MTAIRSTFYIKQSFKRNTKFYILHFTFTLGMDRHVSRRQQKALVFLSLIVLLAIVVPSLWQRGKGGTETAHDTLAAETFRKEIAFYSDSLSRLQEQNDSLRKAHYRKDGHTYDATAPASRPSTRERRGNDSGMYEMYPRPHVAQRLSFELNSADTLDLQQLRGIGPVFARRIVNYRAKLGGYVSTAQLREIYGMSEETYQMILPYLTVDTMQITKLNPNTATLNQLKQHPYLDYYQARAIVDYRREGHAYRTVDDLLLVNLITDSVLLPLRPYLTF